MANIMNDVYHGCLCNTSSLELISFKNKLLRCIEEENFSSVLYQPLISCPGKKEVHCNNLVLLQILTEQIYLKVSDLDNVCGETLNLLSSIFKNMTFYRQLKNLLAVENVFIQYTVAKLISSIMMSLPEVTHRFVMDLSCELKTELSESNKIAIITLFQKALCFSRFTPDHFQGPNVVQMYLPETLEKCKTQTKQASSNVVNAQCHICEILVHILPILLQDLSHFQIYFRSDDKKWLLNEEEKISFNKGLMEDSLDVHQCDMKEIPMSEPRLLFSILHLWQSFAAYINENNFIQKKHIFQYQEKWNWANLLKIVFHSSSSVSVLLLNILNYSVSYQGKQTENALNSLPSCVFKAVHYGCLSCIPVRSCSWGFGGLIECTSENAVTRFCGSPVLQKFVLLVLKSLANLKDTIQSEIDSWSNVLHALFTKLEFCQTNWIIYLFSEQDDLLIEAMLCCIDIYMAFPDFLQKYHQSFLNPHRIFESFICSIRFDHQVILDFLTSNETCFLLYFIRYLKYFNASLCEKQDLKESELFEFYLTKPLQQPSLKNKQLVEYSDSETEEEYEETVGKLLKGLEVKSETSLCEVIEIERICSMYDELRVSISKLQEKKLFPYNPQPLLKLLDSCSNISKNKF